MQNHRNLSELARHLELQLQLQLQLQLHIQQQQNLALQIMQTGCLQEEILYVPGVHPLPSMYQSVSEKKQEASVSHLTEKNPHSSTPSRVKSLNKGLSELKASPFPFPANYNKWEEILKKLAEKSKKHDFQMAWNQGGYLFQAYFVGKPINSRRAGKKIDPERWLHNLKIVLESRCLEIILWFWRNSDAELKKDFVLGSENPQAFSNYYENFIYCLNSRYMELIAKMWDKNKTKLYAHISSLPIRGQETALMLVCSNMLEEWFIKAYVEMQDTGNKEIFEMLCRCSLKVTNSKTRKILEKKILQQDDQNQTAMSSTAPCTKRKNTLNETAAKDKKANTLNLDVDVGDALSKERTLALPNVSLLSLPQDVDTDENESFCDISASPENPMSGISDPFEDFWLDPDNWRTPGESSPARGGFFSGTEKEENFVGPSCSPTLLGGPSG